jgi:hypothetical protein
MLSRIQGHFSLNRKIVETKVLDRLPVQALEVQTRLQWQAGISWADPASVTYNDEQQRKPFQSVGIHLWTSWISPNGFEENVVPLHERIAIHLVPRPAIVSDVLPSANM